MARFGSKKTKKPIFSAYPNREMYDRFIKHCEEKRRSVSSALIWLVKQELKEKRVPKNSIKE